MHKAGSISLHEILSAGSSDPLLIAATGRAEKLLTREEMNALRRFFECCEDSDSGGHDVPKIMIRALCELGALCSLGFNRHETTRFGDWLLRRDALSTSVGVEPDQAKPHKLLDRVGLIAVLEDWKLRRSRVLDDDAHRQQESITAVIDVLKGPRGYAIFDEDAPTSDQQSLQPAG